ncbi:hypothetical protein Agub_g3076 [Astrephomene gubernaculifera]|uniref:Uncharacterized protein n=1 Tax=Astrephomene gubernaculifera TaxID=47775 RepID=A0AAD3DJ70_9CHLO|nr:hypothetical protein Agub_g3076 [Astrephomene gubernaculifera]
MAKNLKRQNDGGLGTPAAFLWLGDKLSVFVSKRHKQMSLGPFLRTPADAEETPVIQAKPNPSIISTTGLQKLGQLHIRTQQKQQPSYLTDASTEGRPEVRAEPRQQEPAFTKDDDAFIISTSQTYERTQPDPCLGYESAAYDDVELSLRRTQHYQATSSTQYYSQKHDSNVRTAAAAVADSSSVPVTSSSTPAHEAYLVNSMGCTEHPSVMEANNIEGKGSNQRNNAEAGPSGKQPAHFESAHLPPHSTHALLPYASTGPAVTPELQAGEGVSCVAVMATGDVADNGTTPPQISLPMFSIFTQARVARRHRPIHLIRHGESEYNLACKRRGGFGDPSDIFDARLTPTGEKQARGLRPQLLDLMQQHGDPLFIVSPLSRAIETFLHMLPDPQRLQIPAKVASQPSARSREGAAAGSSGGCNLDVSSKPLDLVICPFLTEFLLTSGDVGRPRSVLIESYPQIAENLRNGLHCERWWYENASRGPNCAINKALNSTEPERLSKARVDRFRQFLLSQAHRPIVVVGHANFFRTLTHDSGYMGNCQMMAWAP